MIYGLRFVSLGLHASVIYDLLSPQVPDIRAALEDVDNGNELANRPVLRDILQKGSTISQVPTLTRNPRQAPHPRHQARLAGNIDLAVLRRENQTATHVTPRIASYAHGLFREQLHVVGPLPVHPDGPSPTQERGIRERLLRLLEKSSGDYRPEIEMRREKRLKPRSVWMTEVKIDGEVFGVSLPIVDVNLSLIYVPPAG